MWQPALTARGGVTFDATAGITYASDPITGITYATDWAGVVYAKDSRTGMDYCSDPATGTIYAADPLGGLYAFDPITRTSFASDPSTRLLYMADASGTVCAADLNTGVTYGSDPATDLLYASDWSGAIYSYDPPTGMTYAADPTSGMVYALDPLGGFYTTDPISGVTFGADVSTGMMCFADANGGVYTADPVTGTNYAADPSTGYVFSADAVSGDVYGVDPDTGAVWQVGVRPGDRPVGAELDTEGESGAYADGVSEPSRTGDQKSPHSSFSKLAVARNKVLKEEETVSAGEPTVELSPRGGVQIHFYTNSLLEVVSKVTDQGYRNDGIAFSGFALPIPGGLPLVRLSHSDGRYLYTTSPADVYDALGAGRYVFDQTLCYVSPAAAPGVTSLYRLENKVQNDAFFTMSLLELQETAEKFGYTTEGIAGHVLAVFVPGAVSVYRLSKVA